MRYQVSIASSSGNRQLMRPSSCFARFASFATPERASSMSVGRNGQNAGSSAHRAPVACDVSGVSSPENVSGACLVTQWGHLTPNRLTSSLASPLRGWFGSVVVRTWPMTWDVAASSKGAKGTLEAPLLSRLRKTKTLSFRAQRDRKHTRLGI